MKVYPLLRVLRSTALWLNPAGLVGQLCFRLWVSWVWLQTASGSRILLGSGVIWGVLFKEDPGSK